MKLTEIKHPFISGIVCKLNNPDISKEEFMQELSTTLAARHFGKQLHVLARKVAITKWGMEFTVDSEFQLELDLGKIEIIKPNINPEDKSTAIASIEGAMGQFKHWSQSISVKIDEWPVENLKLVLDKTQCVVEFRARVEKLLSARKSN